MISKAGDAIATGNERYVSFPNMLHTHFSFQYRKGKNNLLISEEESTSVRSAAEKNISSPFPK